MANFFNESTFLATLGRKGLKKHLQKKKIVRLMYGCKALSISELIDVMGLSLPSILSLLDELIKEDLVEIIGSGDSSGGRKPKLYGLKSNSFFVLGIDIGLYATRIAIYNNNNENIADTNYFKIDIDNSKEKAIEIYQRAAELINTTEIEHSRLMGVGISMPGLIDLDTGVNHSYLNFSDQRLRKFFEEKFESPVFIINDAQAKAVAELRFGQAKGKKNVIVLNVSSGLSTGLILNGQVYHGTNGFSGEFSHTPFVENGILCSCGKKGCLETVASGLALKRNAIKGLKNGVTSIISELVDNKLSTIQSKHVVEAARKGDQFSIGLIAKVGYELGKGASVLVQTLNPELIIMSGRVSHAGSFLTLSMEQALNEFSLFTIKENVKIVQSNLGNTANLIGSIAYVIGNVLEN
ncbi:MAG: ROK family protein [Bacteroidales bacterium]|nr:ROK family protein [Bacteroidales bacterium]